MKASFLTLLLLFSCTKYATLTKDVGVHVQNVEMDLTHLNEIEWNVGKKKEHKISQSFVFIVELPKLKKEDLDYLVDQKGIDAWIIRVIQVHGSEKQDLGSFYTLFRPRKLTRGISTGAATSASVKIYYAASYASERFRNFKCPPFNHNRKLDDISIKGETAPFEMSLNAAISYPEKSQLIELTPSAFNGGHSLAGEFYLEIAAYDSKDKMIHSAFKRLPRYVAIGPEEQIDIQSCAGVHPEIEL